MKLGLFGGSFDPIHHGHLRPVRVAMETLGLDEVLFLPTARPPHKPQRDFAPALVRYVMVELALLDEEGMSCSDFEMRADETFTIDTVRHFRRRQPAAEIFLLIGEDSFIELDQWREWRALVDEARIVVMHRPGSNLEEQLPAVLEPLVDDPRVTFLANRPVGLSSSEIRRRLRAGGQLSADDVPPLVLQYLRKYSPYS